MATQTLSMVIKPKVRGFICVTAHPEGCAHHVQEQINYIKKQPSIIRGPKKVLIIGASTGYGLASRIQAAFGSGAATLGVFYERPAEGGKPATAGWYNSSAFKKVAEDKGLYAFNINGDAFSDEIKHQTIETIKKDLGKVDLVIYSLAAPRRIHPRTGQVFNSILKPIGRSFTAKTLDTDKEIVKEITIASATEQEINDTTAVMGGEDWQMWMEAMQQAGVLDEGVISVAYSYIGPKVTWPIYRNGTIGRAKAHLESTVKKVNEILKKQHGSAYVSINKALITQASSAIPVVPLYISLLYKVMKKKGTHEGCIEQVHRLFTTRLYASGGPLLDEEGRIRLDDWEMDREVQSAVEKLWPQVTTENIRQISDLDGYQKEFLRLFGFGFSEVDYEAPVNLEV